MNNTTDVGAKNALPEIGEPFAEENDNPLLRTDHELLSLFAQMQQMQMAITRLNEESNN